MGTDDNNRTASGISKYLPSGVTRTYRWVPKGRILYIDIATTSAEELDWVHDQMIRREPCVAMVRVNHFGNFWAYYTGAAVRDKYHLTTIGEFCFDLMYDALVWNESA